MSERLSSVEIEDVLSSIRRLVSEDLRPGAKAEAAAPPTEAVPTVEPGLSGDKLILTPALRIAPEAVEAAPEGEEEAMPAFTSVRQGRGASVVDRVARAMPDEDWEPVSEADPVKGAAGRSDWSTEDEAAVAAAGADWAAAPVSPVAQPSDPEMGLDPVADAGEGAGWPAPDAPEANWSAPGEQAPMEAEAPEDPVWSEVEPMAIDRPAPPAPEMDVPMPEGEQAMAEPLDPMQDEGAAPQDPRAVEADLPDWARMEAEAEPEVEVMAGPSAAGRADAGWADAAEAEIRRELEDEATATVFARFDDADHDDRHFDEDMLRDLVRDIIREELQGALGERITRNVRKLVRAEIARALAVRDFE